MRLHPKRSDFLAAGAALGAVAVNTVRAPVRAAQFTYRLAHADPVELSTNQAMVAMAAAIERESNGRLKIQVYPNSQLGSQTALVSQLRLGSIQLSFMNVAAYAQVVPLVQIAGVGFAFNSFAQALGAMDGPFGDYVRKEVRAKGFYVFDKVGMTGFRQMMSSLRPIRNADDLAGYRVRTLPAPLFVDLFKTLGAAPVALNYDEVYTAAQTHLIDGIEVPLSAFESSKFFEVQKYLSLTNHIWTTYMMLANVDAWNALPPDLQAIVTRNQATYALRERRDSELVEGAVADKLRRQGMIFNTADTTGMRARLGPYYAKCRDMFGPTAWALLEEKVGKLG